MTSVSSLAFTLLLVGATVGVLLGMLSGLRAAIVSHGPILTKRGLEFMSQQPILFFLEFLVRGSIYGFFLGLLGCIVGPVVGLILVLFGGLPVWDALF